MSQADLDNLAQNGIIGFDADSYVRGVPPRYVGKPDKAYKGLPFEQPGMPYPSQFGIEGGEKLKGEPENDAFVSQIKDSSSRPSLKEIIVGSSLLGVGLYVLSKGEKIKNLLKYGVRSKEKAKAVPKEETNTSFFKKWTNKIKSLFGAETKTAAAESSKPEVENKIEVEANKAVKKGFFKRIPKWAKITGGIGLGLLVAYEAFLYFAKRKRPAGEVPMVQNPQIGNEVSQPPEVVQGNNIAQLAQSQEQAQANAQAQANEIARQAQAQQPEATENKEQTA